MGAPLLNLNTHLVARELTHILRDSAGGVLGTSTRPRLNRRYTKIGPFERARNSSYVCLGIRDIAVMKTDLEIMTDSNMMVKGSRGLLGQQ